jgi:hypothetical protein
MTCYGELRYTRLDLLSAARKMRARLRGAIARVTFWLMDVRPRQIFALLVALTVVAPPGFQLARGNPTFLSPLRTELIPLGASVQARHQLSVQNSEARLSHNRVSLGLAATLFTVPPIRHGRPLLVTTNYCHRAAAHMLALLRAPPLDFRFFSSSRA